MSIILTLVADGTATTLDAAAIAAVARAVPGKVGVPDWLAPGIACDLPLEGAAGASQAALQQAAREALGDRPIDAVAQAAGPHRRKGLLVADMDSTIVVGETLDEMAALAGIGDKVAEITRRAMNGEIDFAGALRERVGLLAGQPAELIERVLAATALMPGAEVLVRTMRAHGASCVLVSGGFEQFTGAIGQRCGFHRTLGNRLILAEGRFTGQVAEPILDRDTKLATLRESAAALRLPAEAVLAVGDGANDLPMLLAAGLGVAYRAKPSVKAAAGVCIDHADLTALLYLQGYRADELVR